MKRLFAFVLALGVAITIAACGQRPAESAAPGEAGEVRLGTLSLLNMTEEERLARAKLNVEGVKYLADKGVLVRKDASEPMPELAKVVSYDTLDAMVMALEAGDIDYASVPHCTAAYLRAHNDRLEAADRGPGRGRPRERHGGARGRLRHSRALTCCFLNQMASA